METNIALFIILAGVSIAGKGQPTASSLDAYLRYTGANNTVNDISRNIERTVPEEAKIYVASGVYLGKTIIDRKVVVTWSFP